MLQTDLLLCSVCLLLQMFYSDMLLPTLALGVLRVQVRVRVPEILVVNSTGACIGDQAGGILRLLMSKYKKYPPDHGLSREMCIRWQLFSDFFEHGHV